VDDADPVCQPPPPIPMLSPFGTLVLVGTLTIAALMRRTRRAVRQR